MKFIFTKDEREECLFEHGTEVKVAMCSLHNSERFDLNLHDLENLTLACNRNVCPETERRRIG